MENKRNLYSVLKKICVLTFFFAGVWQNLSANKLDLTDNGVVKIYGVGKQSSTDSIFCADKSQKIPNKISIDELALSYTGAGQKAQLTIINGDNDTIFDSSCKNGITPGEFSKGIRFYIHTDKEYTFLHGDKTWKLKFPGKPDVAQPTAQATTTDKLSSENTNEAATEGSSWWQILLIVLGVEVIIAGLLFICYNKGLLSAIMGGPKPGAQQDQPAQEAPTNSGVNEPAEVGKNDSDKANEAIQEVLNQIKFPEDAGEYSITEKIFLINKKLSSGQSAANDLKYLKQVLGVDTDCTVDDMAEKFKSLGQKKCEPTEEQRNAIIEQVSASLINKIRELGNKRLNSLVEKAQAESKSQKDYFFDSLRRFFKLLSMEKGNEQPSQPSADFDHLMNAPENRLKMMRWAIGKIEDEGYKGLNKNDRPDETFKKIATLLLKADSPVELPSPEKIVDDAIANDNLTEEQKNVLLHRLIAKINSNIDDASSSKLDNQTSLADFTSKIAEKIQTPSTHEEAENNVRKSNLKAVNELLESDITEFDSDALINALRIAIVKHLNKQIAGLNVETYDDAMSKLANDVSASKAINDLLNKYSVSNISELPSAIQEKQSTDLITSVDKKVNELLPDKHIDTIPKLVNALFKLAEDAKYSKELIADAIEEKISMRNSEYVASDEKDVVKLFDNYVDIVTASEKVLNKQVAEKSAEITRLEGELTKKEEANSALTNKNKKLMSDTISLIDSLHNGADHVMESCKTILNPCSDSDESQCIDIEDRLFDELNKIVNRFKVFSLAIDVTPVEARTSIQKLLVEELSKENSPLNTICRYYAYSRLPFMTDTSREYGITFNRKNMSDLYSSIEALYVQFGININIPDLFVAGFEEGNFENLTGQTYGDLDNLCQNSRNHFDNIDSNAKPNNVIVDVVNVGYSVDGKVGRITSVLTY